MTSHSKKRRRVTELYLSADVTASRHSSIRRPYTLHTTLAPVHFVFHSFLSDADAGRLMRVSLSFTTAILKGYTFHQHVFQPTLSTTDSLQRLTSLYSLYAMRVTRLSLHPDFNSPLLDSAGRSVLPSSLVTLALGEGGSLHESPSLTPHPSLAPLFDLELTMDGEPHSGPFYLHTDSTWRTKISSAISRYNQPLLPAALPSGLRHLQLPMDYDQPLLPGSIPSTVILLVLDTDHNHPLRGVLPPSLTRLHLGHAFQQPLHPGDLPASLQQLGFGVNFNQPLECGSLPAGLKALELSLQYNQPLPPGVLPPSLTHLSHGCCYNQPLQLNTLPVSLSALDIGFSYDKQLDVLPEGLRWLATLRRNEDRIDGLLRAGCEVRWIG